MTGPLALLGSGEFEPWTTSFEEELLRNLPPGPVLIVPTASAPDGDAVFEDWGAKGFAHFAALGRDAEVAEIRRREDAARTVVVEAAARAALVYLSGGNPAYLAATLAGTPFWQRVVEGYRAGAGLVGCSAGAVVLGARAFDPARSRDDPGFWSEGLGVLPRTILVPHWDTMDRFRPGARAWFAEHTPPGWRLVAIDEETAVVASRGGWRVHGRGAVRLSPGGGEPARAGDALPALDPP